MTANIVHLPERGVFRQELGGGLALETEDTCAVCGQKSDEPVLCSSCSMSVQVTEAMEWLRDHPEADHMDAAMAVASRHGGDLGRSNWPKFIAQVRAAATEAEGTVQTEAER